jgi:soluble lytic murein transglycosylase
MTDLLRKHWMRTTALALLGAGLLYTVIEGPAQGSTEVQASAAAPADQGALPPSMETTGAIPTLQLASATVSDLKSGLDALSNRDIAGARAIRDGLALHSIDRHILTWSIAMSSADAMTSDEIAAASEELIHWPGQDLLANRYEQALFRENPPAETVIAKLGGKTPGTPEGARLLARAYVALGKTDEAHKVLARLWTSETLDASTEDAILDEFPDLVSEADNRTRMQYLLYRGKVQQAERFARLGKAWSLYQAWKAVAAKSSHAEALIAAVDNSWAKDPGYLYLRVANAQRQDKYEEAARLLKSMPDDLSALVVPGEWWDEQRIVARGLFEDGKAREAYDVVAAHTAARPVDKADAEFHAGWFALVGLKDGALAAPHFQKILDASDGPISQSRAWYWLGRAAEAGGPGKADDYYNKAAGFSATFYGQLAAARLKQPGLAVVPPSASMEDRHRFQSNEAVQAIARLEAAGYGWRAESLYRALARQFSSSGELALLCERAEREHSHQLSLQLGKIAQSRGVDVTALAFPVGAIPDDADISRSGKALAYAIARQESAFNPAAISPANARGLLQLLPGTAKEIAGRYGLAYSQDRLTTDAGYNATLGAHFLGEQIDSFGGSFILTFAAYNAGPNKIPEWISRFGDPRGMPLDDVINWIEMIPYPETRNYVQRIMENYEVYKARLGERADIVADLMAGANIRMK